MAERVLMVGAYPIENAIGGGQMRARALRDRYRAHGLEVRYCGVFYKGFYDTWSRDDIPVSAEGAAQILHSPWTGDVICSDQLH
ncbi:MAG: hypothetical protein JO347_12940, partial [Candidatus Eremiobacteraeota bacterium]|nr:hypothetical protein [Candidatus Eremiobacteraeota bacterium]